VDNNKYIRKFGILKSTSLPLNIAVALVYIILAKIGLFFALKESGITIFWPAGGFAMAILLLVGPKYLPGVFIGALGAGFMVGGSLFFSVFTALGNSLETFCGYWLLTHYRNMNRSLDSSRDLFQLLFYGAFVSSLASAIIGPVTFLALNIIDTSQFQSVVVRWWMADAIGIAFVTPFVLIWRHLPSRLFSTDRLWEMIALFGLTYLSAQIVFFGWFSSQSYQQVSVAWLFPFIIWAGLRAGRHKVTLLQLMLFTRRCGALVMKKDISLKILRVMAWSTSGCSACYWLLVVCCWLLWVLPRQGWSGRWSKASKNIVPLLTFL
jgi:integral membrane sensor domain MASE1